ncbi:MAG: DUF551 domain-containing protein [Dorea sp.]
MIDEKKICNYIKEQINPYGKPFEGTVYEFGLKIMDYIENMEKVGEWIPVSERLPEDCDNRFYMCILENHEEDLPMFCQYEEDYGFGFWHDIYDEYTLGFVDTEFKTNEELGYEKVIAWQPLPEPYKLKEVM